MRRRRFLRHAASASGAVFTPSLLGLMACNEETPFTVGPADRKSLVYGPLAPSADSPELEIPEGFRCVRIGWGGEPSRVHDGWTVPNAFDGMGAFSLPNGNLRLIRNHEMVDPPFPGAAIGNRPYDPLASGGTTSVELRITGTGSALEIDVVDEFVSLSGTRVNCAGGATPWGTWLSCEEITSGPIGGYEKAHGYVFEVPALATEAVEPLPLRAMGRFVHEAVAVDPESGTVYLTEDAPWIPGDDENPGSGLYRFLPDVPGDLAAGGRLEMLAVEGEPRLVTVRGLSAGAQYPATWVPIGDPDPRHAEVDPHAVFRQGHALGGAVFGRLEGAFAGDGGIYVVATAGGSAGAGQVFHYRPATPASGVLTLVFESPSPDLLDGPDNICLSRRGGIILCEDGTDDQFVRGLDRNGRIIDLVRAPRRGGTSQPGEFAGACWSPDGGVLFFNTQGSALVNGTDPSGTYALWGPWERGPL